MNAEILSIGTEILLGDILNTNTHFLSNELAKVGVSVYYHTAVGDNPNRLLNAYKIAFERSDIVITTGGLGPTEDDLTKETAAKYFNKNLVLHEASLAHIQESCKKYGVTLTDSIKKQAYIIENATALKNDNGTAPGCILEENGKILIMLPGPPREATNMYLNEVKPFLLSKSTHMYISKTIHICGIGESQAENLIKDLIDTQTNPSIAPYAKTAEVVFRITAKAKNEAEANSLIAPIVKQMYANFGSNIFGEDGTTIEQAVITLLTEKRLTLACAESCTGGMVTSRLVNCPGASKVLLEGAVTYSNNSKIQRLGVKEETLQNFGAVSEEVASQMAQGIAKTSCANIGIATTGIAGPTSDNPNKPAGLVYIAIYYKNETVVQKFNFSGNRENIRTLTTMYCLDILRRKLVNDTQVKL